LLAFSLETLPLGLREESPFPTARARPVRKPALDEEADPSTIARKVNVATIVITRELRRLKGVTVFGRHDVGFLAEPPITIAWTALDATRLSVVAIPMIPAVAIAVLATTAAKHIRNQNNIRNNRHDASL
jgi:hypothetical protein